MTDPELEKEKQGLSIDAKTLHEDIFKEQKPKTTKELVNDAREMVRKGETFSILIPKGGRIDVMGVPFTVAKVKHPFVTLCAAKGYKLLLDTPGNREKLKYEKPEEKEDTDEETS